MQDKDINRMWMIKCLKFFRALFHVGVCASILSVFLSTGLAVIGCVCATALCAAISDSLRIDLEFPSK